MSKVIAIWLVLFLTANGAFGQGLVDTPSNSLLRHIRQSKSDTSRVKFLLALSKQLILRSGSGKLQIDSAYMLEKQAEKLSVNAEDLKNRGNSILIAALIENKKGNSNNGLAYAQQALSYFNRINDPKDQAEANIIIGQHYPADTENDILKRINYYKAAIDLFEKAGEKERMATTLVDLADLQQIISNLNESVKNLREALKIYKEIGYKGLTNLYGLLGNDLLVLGDKEDALKYELEAEKSAAALKDSSLQLSTVYYRISECFSWLKNLDKALIYSKKGLAVANRFRDSSHIYVHIIALAHIYAGRNEPLQSIHFLDKVKDWPGQRMIDEIIYANALYVKDYTDLKKYNLAKKYLDTVPSSIKNNARLVNTILSEHLYYLMGSKQYSESYPYLKWSKRVTDNAGLIKSAAQNEYYWFQADSALGKYQTALRHYQRNRLLSDSVFTLAKDKQVALLQIEYETEKKQQQVYLQAKSIELLKNNALLENQKQRSRLYVLIGVLTITLTILGFGFSRYRLKQHTNLQLEANQIEINRANISLQGLVSEKDWLLKEVHHRVKNNLQIVMSLLSSQSAYLENTAAIEAIRESQNRVQAISLIHQKLYQSSNVASINMPAYVADLLDFLADSFDTRRRHIKFEQVVESFNLDLAQAVPIGLILNESVTNAIKYAFDDKDGLIVISLQLIRDETMLLAISDNGKGFPKELDLQNTSTLGMEMMKALSKQLGGGFRIENKGGVRISIEFQIEKVFSGMSEKASGALAGNLI